MHTFIFSLQAENMHSYEDVSEEHLQVALWRKEKPKLRSYISSSLQYVLSSSSSWLLEDLEDDVFLEGF